MSDKAKQDPGVCTVCGRRFTETQRPPFVRNLNLWGGVDVICRQCAIRQEQKTEERMRA